MTKVPLLIVGGGIGGLATAVAIAKAGRPVHLIEQAPQFAEVGAGIQLAPNALRVLWRLGVYQLIEPAAVKPRHIVMLHAITGTELTRLDVGERFREHYGTPYIVMHRMDLLLALLEVAQREQAITLETNRTVTGVEHLPDGSVRIRTQEGFDYHADALIGADGLWSTVRGTISDDEPVCSDFVAYRGAIPVQDLGIDIDSDDEIIWIGPGRHLVQYPIRRGELYNQVGVFRSRQFRPEIAHTEQWGTVEELDEAFADSCDRVRESVGLLGRTKRWAMYDREAVDNWTHRRATLIGDAAHPVLQYLAQGACQAIEDADEIAHQLGRSDDVAAAFHQYQAVRLPHANRVQAAARWWGELWHADDALVPPLRDHVLRTRAWDDFSMLDWLYR